MDFSNYLKRKRCSSNTPGKEKKSSSGFVSTPICITFPQNERAMKYKISMGAIIEDTIRENLHSWEETYYTNFAKLYEQELETVRDLAKKSENATNEIKFLNTNIEDRKTKLLELSKEKQSIEKNGNEKFSKFDIELAGLNKTIEEIEIEYSNETLKMQEAKDKLNHLSDDYFQEKESIQMIEKGNEIQENKIQKGINKKSSLESQFESCIKVVSVMKAAIEELKKYQMEDEKCKTDILLQISYN